MDVLRSSDHVVIVGAGLAGWRLTERLREEGFEGEITLVGDEKHVPYDRPPLSKQVLSGRWDVEKAILATPEKLSGLRTSIVLGSRATHLDVDTTSVHLADGRVLEGTRVVVATGTRAKRLHFESSGELMSLRSYDDVVRLNEALEALDAGGVVAVIGGGFVGAEAATSIKTRGFTPVVLEVADRPLITVVGEVVSAWLHQLADAFGVEVRTKQCLTDVVVTPDGVEVMFENGRPLKARAVLAAVGSALDVAWLERSGLTLNGGVVVDRYFRAAPQVAAIGDVARFPLTCGDVDESVRVEHWQIAADHADRLAKYWTSGQEPSTKLLPYFWSDQYGKKIQMLGHPHMHDEVVLVEGNSQDPKWLALYSRNGIVSGVIALSHPRGLSKSKVLLDRITSLDDALALAPWAS